MLTERKYYMIVFDSGYSTIELVSTIPDNYEIFNTFIEAKRELIKHLNNRIDELKFCKNTIKTLTEKDIK